MPRINLEEGGVVRYVLDICNVLALNGVRVTLITQEATDIPSDWLKNDGNLKILLVKKSLLPFGILNKNSLKLISSIFDKDSVIHFHVPWLLSNYQLARVALKKKIPY